MNNDFLFATKQFNKGLIIAINSLLNDNIQDWWQGSQNITHFQIEMGKMISLWGNQIKFIPRKFHIIEASQKAIRFGPLPITTTSEIDLSKSSYEILTFLKEKKICPEAIDKYRYLFFMFFQMFLQNSPRGSNIDAHLGNLQAHNPLLFSLLRDHTEKASGIAESISRRTLQKQCERYLDKNRYPTERKLLLKQIIEKK